MPLAFLQFPKLSSNIKTIMRFRKLSLKYGIRGMIMTGTPGMLFLAVPPSEMGELHNMVTKIRCDGDRAVSLYWGRIDPDLNVAFPKQNGIKRVATIKHLLDAAKEYGDGGDVVKWIQRGVEKRVPLWKIEEFQGGVPKPPGARVAEKKKGRPKSVGNEGLKSVKMEGSKNVETEGPKSMEMEGPKSVEMENLGERRLKLVGPGVKSGDDAVEQSSRGRGAEKDVETGAEQTPARGAVVKMPRPIRNGLIRKV